MWGVSACVRVYVCVRARVRVHQRRGLAGVTNAETDCCGSTGARSPVTVFGLKAQKALVRDQEPIPPTCHVHVRRILSFQGIEREEIHSIQLRCLQVLRHEHHQPPRLQIPGLVLDLGAAREEERLRAGEACRVRGNESLLASAVVEEEEEEGLIVTGRGRGENGTKVNHTGNILIVPFFRNTSFHEFR